MVNSLATSLYRPCYAVRGLLDGSEPEGEKVEPVSPLGRLGSPFPLDETELQNRPDLVDSRGLDSWGMGSPEVTGLNPFAPIMMQSFATCHWPSRKPEMIIRV